MLGPALTERAGEIVRCCRGEGAWDTLLLLPLEDTNGLAPPDKVCFTGMDRGLLVDDCTSEAFREEDGVLDTENIISSSDGPGAERKFLLLLL